jgi:maltose alpha-D-glucosyltransferase/alpha-amylase
MIALRKLFSVFGRGNIEFLNPTNRKVLAYLRTYGEEQVLCVANLSRFAQPVDLDLSKLEGMVPIEMLGYVEFPSIERQPYRLTLAPYSFLWLELQRKDEPAETAVDLAEQAPLDVSAGWSSILEGMGRKRLETVNLPEYLPQQRWFAGKARAIKSTRIINWAPIKEPHSAWALVEVQFEAGEPEVYQVPLALTFGAAATELRRVAPNAIIASVLSEKLDGLLHDGAQDDNVCLELLSLIENASELRTSDGPIIRGVPGKVFPEILGSAETPLAVRRSTAEQSNTSIVYGDRFILKLFRRLEPGVNPDAEIGRHLTENTTFDRIPPFAGSIELEPAAKDDEATILTMLQGLVANEGDGWKWTIEELDRYFETSAPLPFPENANVEPADPLALSEQAASQVARDHLGIYLDAAETLGRRTAELHLALAAPSDDPAFAPEPLTSQNFQTLLFDLHEHASRVLDVLRERMPFLPDEVIEIAATVLSRRRRILDYFGTLKSASFRSQRIRIHGDYHLGQVLRVKTDFVILDFEGEPARPLEHRRSKQCPLKDVAGMLRSFSYAAYASLNNYSARHSEDLSRLEPWAQLWERSAAAAFLRAYRETARGAEFLPADTSDFRKLLDLFLLDKALYEVRYELNARPAWVRIPLLGIMLLSL